MAAQMLGPSRDINPTGHWGESVALGGVDYLEIYDEAHSEQEDRFIAVGPIKRGVIVVAYTEREDDVLRILSARMATKSEWRRFEAYEKERQGRRDS